MVNCSTATEAVASLPVLAAVLIPPSAALVAWSGTGQVQMGAARVLLHLC